LQADHADSFTSFETNDWPTETIGFDGSKSFAIYNPLTGNVGATWDSLDGSNTFIAGMDSKTLYTPSALTTSASTPGGMLTQVLSTSGIQSDNATSWNGGLNSSDLVNGLLTQSVISLPSGAGQYTRTTVNPHGTKTLDTYADGLLASQQQLGATGSTVASTSLYYNPQRLLSTMQTGG
jgi:hypothetical protein